MSQKSNENIVKDITASLGRIVRYSFNDEFRNQCFQLLNVDCTQDFEREITKRLQNTPNYMVHFPEPDERSVHSSSTPVLTSNEVNRTIPASSPSVINQRPLTQSPSFPTLRTSQTSWRSAWSGRRHRVEPYGTVGQASMSQLLTSPHSSQGCYASQSNPMTPNTNLTFFPHSLGDIWEQRADSTPQGLFFDSDD